MGWTSQNQMTEEQLSEMFARWNAAEESNEVPAIKDYQWYGELKLTVSDDGITFITAPIEEYSEDGFIEQVGGFGIPLHA